MNSGGNFVLPKGHVKKKKDGEDESNLETMTREVGNESGITEFLVHPCPEEIYVEREFSRDYSKKTIFFYLLETMQDGWVSSEHKALHWVCFYEAMQKISREYAPVLQKFEEELYRFWRLKLPKD